MDFQPIEPTTTGFERFQAHQGGITFELVHHRCWSAFAFKTGTTNTVHAPRLANSFRTMDEAVAACELDAIDRADRRLAALAS